MFNALQRASIRGQTCGAAAVLVVLTVAMTYPQVRLLRTGIPDHDDPLFGTWRLAWVAHQLPRDPRHLFDANIFYPEPRTLAYSDAMLVSALTAAPFLWVGVPPLVVYNLMLLAGFFFSGLGLFLLARELTGDAGGAIVGAIVFAFAPFRFDHYPHLELQWAQWMPLALWTLDRLVARPSMRRGLLLGLCVALQALSSLYYGIFLCSFLLVVGAVLVMGARGKGLGRLVGPLAAAALVVGAIVVPYARPYRANQQTVGTRSIAQVQRFSATLGSYVRAPETSTLYGRSDRPGFDERNLFPGIAVIMLAAAALWPPVSTVRVAYLAGLLLAFDASLGFGGHISPWLYAHVLPFRGLRALARFGILVSLSLAVLSAFAVARVTAAWAQRWPGARIAVPICCSFVILLESHSGRMPYYHVPPQVPAVYAWLARQPSTVVLELPVPSVPLPGGSHDAEYMYYSVFHWHRLLNGYSGFTPPSYIDLLDRLGGFPDRRSLAELRGRNVEYVVIHRRTYDPDRYGRLLFAIGQHDRDLEVVGGFPDPHDPAVVYRLIPQRSSTPVLERKTPAVGTEDR